MTVRVASVAASGATLTTPAKLWDKWGSPLKKHPLCPFCGADEIGSHYARAWCHRCEWSGELVHLLAMVKACDERDAARREADELRTRVTELQAKLEAHQ